MCGKFFEDRIPLSSENQIIIRPIGQYFINGLNNNYDENYPLGLEGYISQKEYSLILLEINQILIDYWSCPASIFLGYFFAIFTLGLSLLLPYICIRETERYVRDYLAALNFKMLKQKGLNIDLKIQFPISYLIITKLQQNNKQEFEVLTQSQSLK